MSYATPQDLINRYPNRDLVQLTNEDPTITTINTTVLQQALDDASAEIDGYLGGRFILPLTDVPEVLIDSRVMSLSTACSRCARSTTSPMRVAVMTTRLRC